MVQVFVNASHPGPGSAGESGGPHFPLSILMSESR
jgi:hypothetical protein